MIYKNILQLTENAMLDNLLNRYTAILTPGNILINYYVKKGTNNTFSLTDGLFETVIANQDSLNVIENKLQETLNKIKRKGYEIKSKPKTLNLQDLEKLFKIKFGGKEKYNIQGLQTNNFYYYIADKQVIRDDGKETLERNIIFFTNELNEYIGRFTISEMDDYNISIGSIFITQSKQRLGYFSKVIKEDIFNFIDKRTKEIYAFAILKKGLGFYTKLEREGRFKFIDDKKTSGKFILRR